MGAHVISGGKTSTQSIGSTAPRIEPGVAATRRFNHRVIGMAHLRAVELREAPDRAADRFPFSVPLIRQLPRLELDQSVTFLVGENGSGKSTLLEAVALAANLPTVGSHAIDRDNTLDAQRELAVALKLVWNRRATRGFFLRAEDFFGFTKSLSTMRAELLARLHALDEEYKDRSAWAKGLAKMPVLNSLTDMERRYGVNLDANSHGQSFLRLFQSRFVPGGIYLLDEPEAPLSPQSQLGLLAMIGDMVRQDAQFVIATHSPILLGYPGAVIYSCDEVPMRAVEFDALDHVIITREFLNHRENFVRRLLE